MGNRKQQGSLKHLLPLLTFLWNFPFWGSNTPVWRCPALLQARLSEAPCSPPSRHLPEVLISSRGISSEQPGLCSGSLQAVLLVILNHFAVPTPGASRIQAFCVPPASGFCLVRTSHEAKHSCHHLQGMFPNSLGLCAIHGVMCFSLITPRSPIPLACGAWPTLQ